MDKKLVRRFETDDDFRRQLTRTIQDYIRLGRDALDYWMDEFDVAYDIFMCYAPLTKRDFEQLEKGHPRRFIMPMTSTQVTTMATFISQMLFGQSTPHRVEGRGPEDEIPAEFMNQLLRWNAEQQPMYVLGYLWVQDALITNRAVFYNCWYPILKWSVVNEEVVDFDEKTEDGSPSKYYRPTREAAVVGGYNRAYLVSPYDFICDPTLPLWRFHEMRFSGHRTLIPWMELERRTKLPMDDPAYVMGWAVDALRKHREGKDKNTSPVAVAPGVAASPSTMALANPTDAAATRISRNSYERNRMANPTGQIKANTKDPGIVETWELWVKLIPKEWDLGKSEEPVLCQVLMAGLDHVLAVNVSTYAHGEFPYSVAEARPFGHYQFTPSWVLLLKGLQDHVDWLKNRHQEALSRTIGNIFIADPSKVDLNDFLNPEKEGLLITLKPEAQGTPMRDCIQQVPIKDMTERFQEEMLQFMRLSESTTGVNMSMQGQAAPDDQSATEFAGTQQMAAGRLSSVARILSVMGLVPQTRQFVSNFQQFLETPQMVRFLPTSVNLPQSLSAARSVKISRDTIQGEFDMIAHDGTLPGTDGRKVAAIARLLETVVAFPQAFSPAPGNIDPRKLIMSGAKASGLQLENLQYSAEDIQQAAGEPPPPGVPGAPPIPGPPNPPPPLPGPATARPPGPKPMNQPPPELAQLPLPTAGPPGIRPANA